MVAEAWRKNSTSESMILILLTTGDWRNEAFNSREYLESCIYTLHSSGHLLVTVVTCGPTHASYPKIGYWFFIISSGEIAG